MKDTKETPQINIHTYIHADIQNKQESLETLSVNDGWAGLVVLLFADPHLLKCGKRSQNGSTDPYGVFPLRWSNDLDLHRGGCQ